MIGQIEPHMGLVEVIIWVQLFFMKIPNITEDVEQDQITQEDIKNDIIIMIQR